MISNEISLEEQTLGVGDLTLHKLVKFLNCGDANFSSAKWGHSLNRRDTIVDRRKNKNPFESRFGLKYVSAFKLTIFRSQRSIVILQGPIS